jgi:hypothetical protein
VINITNLEDELGQAVLADWYKYSGGTHPFLFRVVEDVFT